MSTVATFAYFILDARSDQLFWTSIQGVAWGTPSYTTNHGRWFDCEAFWPLLG